MNEAPRKFPWNRCSVWLALLLVAGLILVSDAVVFGQGQPAKQEPAKQEPAKKPAKQPAKAVQPAPPAPEPKPIDYDAILKNLRWRELGPAIMGGRIDDFAVVESDPRIIFAGIASGGVWKSINAGTTWTPVFDNEEVPTIGDVAIAPSDPSIVWVGTGEPNNRQSSSWGNGAYKSEDGGKTWKNMGLRETHHIGRIVIHPTNPNIVYVAALGKLWGPNKERGLFKTTDGGKTWTNVLFINEDTGVVDVILDPQSPDTLLAGAYQRRRTVFGYNGGGPGGGIYKTTDAGATWKKLEKGLPWDPNPLRTPAGAFGGFDIGQMLAATGMTPEALGIQLPQQQQPQAAPEQVGTDIGRIGLAVYGKNPNIMYALVEHAKGGIFRSEDKGDTWTKMSDTNPRASYYSQVIIDPNNDLRIWVLGAPVYFSEDGGKTFVQNRGGRIHGDYHALWIDPAKSEHMITGTDGGIHQTWDGGRTWDFINTLALGQFYEIDVSMEKPYKVCGGLQDNGSWCAPAATLFAAGVTNDEWFRVGGGDGFHVKIDPTDGNTVYAESQDGNISRLDLRTGQSKSIRPQPKEGEPRYRFQWNSPIVISAHDPKTIYYGGNFVFKSPDRGDTWTKISPDLTTNVVRDTLEIFGKKPDRTWLSRHDGVQQWPCITTTSESPRTPQIFWAGTDDGNLQVTRDAGATWKNVADKVPGLPKGTYASRVVASAHADCTAYATFDGHRMNDFNIYVYATTDCGETWKAITKGIANNNGIVNVIREHPKNPDLLFAGTEYGAFVTFDRGANWTRIKMNLPTVPVDDILIHPRDNDLLFGTHGRSIWVLDDITPLQQMSDTVANSDFFVFDIRTATMWRLYGHKGSTGGKYFSAPNPTPGAWIHYYLKTKPAENARIRVAISDKDGKLVREIDSAANAGINRIIWDFRARSPIPPAAPGAAGGGFGGGFGGFMGGMAQAGPRVDPGEYTVKVTFGAQEVTKKLVVEEDPRIQISDADRAARRNFLNQIAQISPGAVMAQRSLQSLRAALTTEMEAWKRPGAPRIPDNVKQAAEDYLKKIDEVYPKFATLPQPQGQLGSAGPALSEAPPTPLPQRLLQLAGAIENYMAAPTAWQLEQLSILQKEVSDALPKVRPLMEGLASLNKLMNEAGIPHIVVQMPTGGGGRRQPDDDQP
jgi:photosystem II stability/assembly factor-like uncharacterized protein